PEHGYLGGVRRPHPELHARRPVQRSGMRTKRAIEPGVTAFPEEVDVVFVQQACAMQYIRSARYLYCQNTFLVVLARFTDGAKRRGADRIDMSSHRRQQVL